MDMKKNSAKKSVVSRSNKASIDEQIDYKNVEFLSQFISERGKILPKTKTGLSSKQQRKLAIAIKRARFIGLLPFIVRV